MDVVTPAPSPLVSAKELLTLLFSEQSRPSLRWLRDQQRKRLIPYMKIGGRIFFNPDQVREKLATKLTIEAK